MTFPRPFSPRGRMKSFGHALRGLRDVTRSQHNMWLHIAIAVLVGGAGLVARLSGQEWLWLIVAITLVLVTEILNTAFEFLCDVVSTDFHPGIAKAKDIAAAAVLVAAVGAVFIGVVIFWPHVLTR